MTRTSGLVLLMLLMSCGDQPTSVSPGSHPTGRYQASATVLQDGSGPSMLCLGEILDSLPPQCGGPEITNWDWSAVTDERRVSGVTWGEYHVIGTFDGKRFTLTDPPGPHRSTPAPEDRFASPCATPPGGWTAPNPSKADGDSQSRAIEHARSQDDFAGAWLHGKVLNVKFTGDLERHEREARAEWGGPLCVSKGERTMRELRAIQSEVTGSAREYDLELLSAGVDEVANVVTLEVVVLHPDTQQRFDERYGKGTVKVTGRLEPVS